MTCSICLNNETELDYITPCNHKFHKKCINIWFESLVDREKTCPECRYIIETPTIIIIEVPQINNYRRIKIRTITIIVFIIDFIVLYYYCQNKSYYFLEFLFLLNLIIISLFRLGILGIN